jgi:HlyD family secretion protein
VLKVFQESEGVVQAGTPLIELGDPAALEIVVDVLTSDAVNIAAGAKVTIGAWGGPPLPARVRMVEPSAFTRLSALGVEEQRVNVLIDLDGPHADWEALGDGYRVEANIVVWEADSAITVPASSVFRHDKEWAVYRIVDHRAVLTPIVIGHRNAQVVEVMSGVEADTTVVLHPTDRVKDGVEVVGR